MSTGSLYSQWQAVAGVKTKSVTNLISALEAQVEVVMDSRNEQWIRMSQYLRKINPSFLNKNRSLLGVMDKVIIKWK